MTQNPYQQGPPPGYDPAYQQAPPAGYPQQAPPPQGGPSPFSQAGPAGPPPAGAPGEDPFAAPGPVPIGGGDSPALHQLVGRLLMIRPYKFEKDAPGLNPGQTADQIMAEIVVCDGAPIPGNINGSSKVETPFATGPKVPPFFCPSMFIKGQLIVPVLEPFVAGRGFVLGRLVYGKASMGKNPPYHLVDPTDADRVIGRQVHAQWEQIKAAAMPPVPDQFQAGAGQQAQQGYPPQGPPQGYGQPQYPQAPPPQGYPGYPAQNPYGAPPAQPPYPPY